MSRIDMNWVVPNLAQGSFPESFPAMWNAVDVIFLMAHDCQARSQKEPPGKIIVRVPMKDDIYRPVEGDVAQRFLSASEKAARYVRSGKRVAVTCAAGWNRSGVVSALTVMRLMRMPAHNAVSLLRQRRPRRRESDGSVCYPLMNPMFEQFVLNQRVV